MLNQIHEFVNLDSYRRMSADLSRLHWEFLCGVIQLPEENMEVDWDLVFGCLDDVVDEMWAHIEEEFLYEERHLLTTLLRFYRFHMMGTEFYTDETHERLIELIQKNAKGSLETLLNNYLGDLLNHKVGGTDE